MEVVGHRVTNSLNSAMFSIGDWKFWRCAASSLNPYPTKDSDVLRSGSCRVAGSRGFARPDCHGGDVCEERFGG